MKRAEHLKRRKELYEAKYPETKKGGDKGNQYTGGKPRQSEIISFSQDTANKLNISPRTVQQEVQIEVIINTKIITKI